MKGQGTGRDQEKMQWRRWRDRVREKLVSHFSNCHLKGRLPNIHLPASVSSLNELALEYVDQPPLPKMSISCGFADTKRQQTGCAWHGTSWVLRYPTTRQQLASEVDKM